MEPTSRRGSPHHGAAGPQSVLEGKFGLYHAFLGAEQGAVDIAAQLADLGSRWETPRIAYKPYPVCHFMHGSLGSAAQATAGRTFTSAEIDDVLVRVPAAGVSLVLEPAEQKRVPRSEYEGKFSLQYSVASQLVRGHVSVGDFTDEAITDPEVLAVAAKVRYETREYPTYPQAFPGGVRRPARATAPSSRPTSPTRRAAPRTRSPPTRCARSSARTRRSPSRMPAWRRSRRPSSRSRSRTT